ncbi:E3 SUMO-protein ligase KIAA1586-like [Schistocerca piceifrons]|uniref:E3 SUMO-protein ligase KIAA1586-like n=1 Tax=Schistocerca piceifrons TaxID=274613 RepID=UPI001F5F65CF|nr:E3 SUMO-protein ligase KIAA1586-like [Schistocerca piceifrons]
MDESTTVSNKTCLIIYLRLPFEGVACNYFFDIVELESGKGECVFSTLLAALEKYGITNDILKNHLVGGGGDSLYSAFSRRPKNQRLLQSVSQELSSQLLKLGCIFRVCWVASSFNAVRALLESHTSLVHLFEKLGHDGSRSTQERSKVESLLKHLTKWLLVMELVMLYEALEVLQVLPFIMQNRNSLVLKAKQEIDVAIRTLETPKTNDSLRIRMIVQELEAKRTVKGLLIKEPSYNIKNRFEDLDFFSDVAALNSDTWPSDDYEHVIYGDMSLSRLFNKVDFKLRESTCVSLVNDFRIYKENPQYMPNSVKELVKAVEVITISTDECERGFSAMNLTLTDQRNHLQVPTLSNLLLISINGPPLHCFDAEKYAARWIKSQHHSELEKSTGKPSNLQEQSHSSRLFN